MSHAERTRSLSTPPELDEPHATQPSEGVRELGPYVISGEIGRGGLGRVFEAWDTRLGRAVAVKEPLHGGRAAQTRFAREARLTARLQHPGVVPIYEVGETPAGEPYYVMRFVAGRSLRDLIEERQGLAARLALLPSILAVADTMAYAHSRSIVHRDLKPANVLVGAFGETVVIDWGLGKCVDDDEDADDVMTERAHDSEITAAGSVLGTPAFMPPEQAAGQPVDLRADVYALGAILYHLLTGVAPYAAVDAGDDSLAAVRRGPPLAVIALEPTAPRDLVAIVEKAMARDPGQRYATAAQVAEDLRRFQTGQLVLAQHYSRLALGRRWLRRNAVWTSLAAVLAVVVVLGALGGRQILSARRSADSARRLAELRTRELGASAQQTRRQADSLLLGDAARRLAEDPAHALDGLARYPLDGADWPRIGEMAIEAARLGLPDWITHVGSEASAAFAPDGASLAVVTPRAVTVIDAATGAHRRRWPLQLEPFDAIAAVSWLASERLLVTLRSGMLIAFDHGSRRDLACSRATATSVAPALAAAVGADDGTVTLCDLRTGRVDVLHRHRGTAADVALAGARVFSVGRDGILAAATIRGQVQQRDLGAGPLAALALRASGGRLDVAVGTETGDLLLVDGETLRVRKRLRHFEARFVKLAWLPGSELLVVATSDHIVRAVRLADSENVDVAAGDGFALSPGGDWIAVAGTDGLVTLFDPRSAWHRTVKAHRSALLAISLAPDGRIATVGADGTLRLWGRSNRPERLYAFDGMGAYLDSYPGRDDFAIASDMGQLQLCRPSGPCRVTRLPAASPALIRLGAITDPIAAADLGRGIIHLFDRSLTSLGRIDTGDPLRELRALGSRFLAVSSAGALYLADARDHSIERIEPGPACSQVVSARWLSEQRCLLACRDGALVTFDLETRTPSSSDRLAGAGPPPGIAGMGPLRDGSALVLHESGDLHRLGREPRRLLTCDVRGGRLFEAADGGAWLNDCGGRVRVVQHDGCWTESVDLASGEMTDMDASAASNEVAVGFIDRLVLWSYRDATLRIAGSSMAVYSVEVAGGRVLAASSPGSVQLWDLSDAPAIPTEKPPLASWIGALAERYRFEQENP